MELRNYFAIIRRRLLLVVLCLLVGAAAGYAATPRASTYKARSTVYVGARQLTTYDPGLYANVQAAGIQTIIATFVSMIDSQPIAEAAVARTRALVPADSIVAATVVKADANTQLIRVTVSDPDPAIAQLIANGMAESFVEKIESFEPSATPQPGDVPQLPANVFERAKLPTVPEPTGLTRQMILGSLFGLVVAVGLIFLLEYLDITIKSPSDAERRLELPVLGVIPIDPGLARSRAGSVGAGG